ncbi:ABC transporter substrate-binding protein [Streptoalloteichus hindustanus]|uniref:Carbohydrate ABC transporter substrate-binding protein, CUT1 family n=1 Tax=Streptoalloteichus hindustanus TaxID=2017 RepID=A0A1M5NBK8_STRHI|nr:extracellular solute-binding protein [Streptoalloteichus hindustanus]SHG86878.1 carbohydrate ABC transporter substrate-binding protein, CUT1 family [Streptoalloteichus hindustanus]
MFRNARPGRVASWGRVRAVVLAVVAVLAVVPLSASSCVPGARSAAARPVDRAPHEVRTDPAALGDVTLVVWDQEVRGGQEKQITALNEAFHRRYPNITVRRVARSFADLRDTARLALTGDDPPDVLQVNNGRQDMGAFVRAGLLRPLTGEAAAYGWESRFPQQVLQLCRYPDAGDLLGEGRLHGLPQTGELVGIYYNRAILAELGLTPPRTWAEFDAALATAKRAGRLPIQFGNLDKSTGIHLLGLALHRFVRPEDETALATGRPGASWSTPATEAAARLLVEWVDRGYLPEGFAGVHSDDSWAAFGRGEGLFHVGGSWLVPDLSAAMGDNVGFMLPPSSDGTTGRPVVTGGTGLPFAVSARSRHPDAAAAYLDFITSPEAMTVLARTRNLPATPPKADRPADLLGTVITGWENVTSSGVLVPYLDYATNTAYETIGDSVERLLAKAIPVPMFLEALQADRDADRGGR